MFHVTSTSFLCILVSCLIFGNVFGELRFCHKGPHRISEVECPGGILFKEKIQPTCKYYARTNRVSVAKAKFVGDICNPASIHEIDPVVKGEDDLAALGDGLQYVNFELSGEAITEGNDTGGHFDPEDICTTSCLTDWTPYEGPPEQPMHDEGIGLDPKTISNGKQLEALALAKELFLYMLDDGEEDEGGSPPINIDASSKHTKKRRVKPSNPLVNDVDDGQTLRVLKLLAKSMRVSVAACGPFLTEDFFHQVHKAFVFLTSKKQSVVQDVTSQEYKDINAALNRCLQKRSLNFRLNGTTCPGQGKKIKGVTYYKGDEYWEYRPTGRTWREGRHDPIIEAGWNAVQIVHGYCFESFVDNVLDLHTYELALEGVFTSLVNKHWLVPPKIKSTSFYNVVLMTNDIYETMRNLDACVLAGNGMSPFKKPLPRPYITREALENPKPDPYSNVTESVAKNHTGWTEGIDAYWTYYNRHGGIKGMLNDVGIICLNTMELGEAQSEMDDELRRLKNHKCSNNGTAPAA